MNSQEIFDDFKKGFVDRKFSAGLLIAFIDFFRKIDTPALKASNFDAILKKFPRQIKTAAGKRANTLIIALPEGGTLSLRPFYNEAEQFFRAEHKRFDYPSCAPHATQAWNDYHIWLDALVALDSDQLEELRTNVISFVLETLKSQAFDPKSVRHEPPIFQLLLERFDITARKGEASGASFQGMVFGFLRADNPHLQIEIDKVRTGSKRLQRIADIDGWEGARLAISAEVKQYDLSSEDIPNLHAFANEIGLRGALGIIAALSFKEGVRQKVEGLGLKPLDTDDLLRIVGLWDPLKQRTAVASFIYYARHVEKSASLAERIDKFIEGATTHSNEGRPVQPRHMSPKMTP